MKIDLLFRGSKYSVRINWILGHWDILWIAMKKKLIISKLPSPPKIWLNTSFILRTSFKVDIVVVFSSIISSFSCSYLKDYSFIVITKLIIPVWTQVLGIVHESKLFFTYITGFPRERKIAHLFYLKYQNKTIHPNEPLIFRKLLVNCFIGQDVEGCFIWLNNWLFFH